MCNIIYPPPPNGNLDIRYEFYVDGFLILFLINLIVKGYQLAPPLPRSGTDNTI